MNTLAPQPDADQAPGAASAVPRPIHVRLPVLRRPPGWTVLGETALRTRAVQLLLAEAAITPPSLGSAPSHAHEHAASPAPLHAPVVPLAAVGTGRQDLRAEPGAAGHAAPAQALSWPEPPPRQTAGLGLGLVAMMAVMGLMALAPWLIWAPLAGGLGLGILLLQTGLLKRWLAIRRARAEAAEVAEGAWTAGGTNTVDDAVADANEDAEKASRPRTRRASRRASGADGEWAVQAVQGVKGVQVPALRFAHGGWLLTAALVLVGVQAAMLIATVQAQRATAVNPASADPTSPERRVAKGLAAQDEVFGLPVQRPLTQATPNEKGREALSANRGRPQEPAR